MNDELRNLVRVTIGDLMLTTLELKAQLNSLGAEYEDRITAYIEKLKQKDLKIQELTDRLAQSEDIGDDNGN